ncbi:hypothetical protein ADEAN_001016300 [Angomonas deanei]|uniref:Uncharacterized protein n=1 Tax=Angomonas deanei TaxID=59799 RepID=A0A7G2CTK7_9TRYP|nr:hypothetical protein ADEAN_001016300 [Angomonas deanei]
MSSPNSPYFTLCRNVFEELMNPNNNNNKTKNSSNDDSRKLKNFAEDLNNGYNLLTDNLCCILRLSFFLTALQGVSEAVNGHGRTVDTTSLTQYLNYIKMIKNANFETLSRQRSIKNVSRLQKYCYTCHVEPFLLLTTFLYHCSDEKIEFYANDIRRINEKECDLGASIRPTEEKDDLKTKYAKKVFRTEEIQNVSTTLKEHIQTGRIKNETANTAENKSSNEKRRDNMRYLLSYFLEQALRHTIGSCRWHRLFQHVFIYYLHTEVEYDVVLRYGLILRLKSLDYYDGGWDNKMAIQEELAEDNDDKKQIQLGTSILYQTHGQDNNNNNNNLKELTEEQYEKADDVIRNIIDRRYNTEKAFVSLREEKVAQAVLDTLQKREEEEKQYLKQNKYHAWLLISNVHNNNNNNKNTVSSNSNSSSGASQHNTAKHTALFSQEREGIRSRHNSVSRRGAQCLLQQQSQ